MLWIMKYEHNVLLYSYSLTIEYSQVKQCVCILLHEYNVLTYGV